MRDKNPIIKLNDIDFHLCLWARLRTFNGNKKITEKEFGRRV